MKTGREWENVYLKNNSFSKQSDAGDGITRIVDALSKGDEILDKGTITYVSPPKYLIEVEAQNYKKGSQVMSEALSAIEEKAKKLSVTFNVIEK